VTGDCQARICGGPGLRCPGLPDLRCLAPLAQVAHPRFPIIRRRPEPVESAPRRLAAMAYGHSRLNPAESRRSMQLSRDETGVAPRWCLGWV
jgi:hypothetical protein